MLRHTLCAGRWIALAFTAVVTATTLSGQQPGAVPQQLEERIRVLQRDAERLAAEADSLVGELRRRERERERRQREAAEAEATVAAARQALQHASDRLQGLEAARLASLPDVQTQLVDLYKRGRGRHARLLLGSGSLREFARARRAVAALIAINQQRLANHRQLLDSVREEHAAIERTVETLQAQEAAAVQARAAAQRAVEAQLALVARIESQRELSARYVAELELLYTRLHDELMMTPGASRGAVVAPLQRGTLPWPAAGPVTGRYGETAGRLGGTAVRNGIELAAPEGAPVRAVHAGRVSFAGDYTGFGTLVVLHHGEAHYSLYGYLGGVDVAAGDQIEAADQIGRVGFAPAGPPALYFELRIDGQSVDPVQWFVPR